jgi:Ca2+-binding EF-hand superfamily protein
MSKFGEHWQRKMKTAFKRFDADGDGFLTKNDLDTIADNIIRAGHFTGSQADEIRKNYMDIWEKYFIQKIESDAASYEVFLTNLKIHGKSDLGLTAKLHHNLWFEAVDTNKDDLIQLQEFIVYFGAIGINEEIAKEAFKALDTNHDGVLSREEFITAGQNFVSLEEPSFPADLFFGPLCDR